MTYKTAGTAKIPASRTRQRSCGLDFGLKEIHDLADFDDYGVNQAVVGEAVVAVSSFACECSTTIEHYQRHSRFRKAHQSFYNGESRNPPL